MYYIFLQLATSRCVYTSINPDMCVMLLHYNVTAATTSLGDRNFLHFLHYLITEPRSCMRSVVDLNVVRQHMIVYYSTTASHVESSTRPLCCLVDSSLLSRSLLHTDLIFFPPCYAKVFISIPETSPKKHIIKSIIVFRYKMLFG